MARMTVVWEALDRRWRLPNPRERRSSRPRPLVPQGAVSACSLQGGQSLAETGKRDRNANARLLGLENDEDCGLARLELLNEVRLGDDLGVTGKVMATHERGMTHVLVVDLETEARRQQHAPGREHPQHALAVGELLKIDGEPDVVAVLRRDALDERAHLVLGAGRRRPAHDLPVSMLGFDGPTLGRLRGGGSG